MAKKNSDDFDVSGAVATLLGSQPERYYLEKYATFFHLWGYLLFPKDTFKQDEMRICAVANIILSIENGSLLPPEGKKAAIDKIAEVDFSPKDCAVTILNLSHELELKGDYMEQLEALESAALISEALLRINTVKHKDPKRNTSLFKAYHFIRSGGFGDGEDEKVNVSVATLKAYWRQWHHAMPFCEAASFMTIDLRNLSPFAWSGAKSFEKRLRKEPTVLLKFLGSAKVVQQETIKCMDPQTKKSGFVKIPDSIEEWPWVAKPLDKKELRISMSYSRSKLV